MNRTALVTGATGLVGSYVVERLVRDGWQVRSLVRDAAAAQRVHDMGSELVQGNVLDARAFGAAAAGCTLIVHAAALVTARGAWEEFRRMNVDGTDNAIAAAEHSGARLVQVSSVSVYGTRGRYRHAPTGEDAPLGPLSPGNHYARSKRESESKVMRAHAQGRIWGTAVRPDVVYGKGDRQFVPRFGRLLNRGVMPVFGSGENVLAIVHAANVADGIARAAVCDAAGGRTYNLANDFDVSVRQFVQLAARGLERRVRIIRVPRVAGRAGISGLALLARFVKGPSFATQARSSFDFLTWNNPFTSERARHELGWDPPMHPAEGIPEAFAWWKEGRA